MQVFDPMNVELINLDSVSGGELRVRPQEVNFSGRKVGGVPQFAKDFQLWASGRRFSAADASTFLTPDQVRSCLVRFVGDEFGLKVEYDKDPLPACTDMTGVSAGLPGRFRRRLRGFSIVSREMAGNDPLERPRDYHQESDNVDTLFLDTEPVNFGTVAALAMTLGAYLR
jgi:hypothetical protein